MFKRLVFLFLLAAAPLAFAQAPPIVIQDPSTMVQIYQGLVGHWAAAISGYATEIFSALAGLEIAWFGINLWRHYRGDASEAFMPITMKLVTLGMFLALMLNAGTWITDIIADFTKIGKDASGLPGLGPSILLQQGVTIACSLLGTSVGVGALFDFTTAVALILAAVVILLSFLVICAEVVLTQVQATVCLGIGYLFLGFGGSRWTAPYVERYFAFTVATGTKLMVLYCVAGAAWPLTAQWIVSAAKAPLNMSGIETSWVIMASAILYALICWKIPNMAAAILGGSPNLTHSDFLAFVAPVVSGAVGAGLAAAGIATGGAALPAAGAAAAGAGAGGGAIAGGASSPSGAMVLQAAGGVASAGAGTLQGMAHSGGGGGSTPHFNGFDH